jgi:hypothetical protein
MFRLGSRQLEIYRANGCPHCELSRRLQDRSRARQWLAQFMSDTAAITAMRGLLSETGSFSVSRMSDAEVMDSVAESLARGAFHVHAHPVYFDLGKQNAPSANTAKEIQYPLSQRQARAPSSRPPVADPPTFGPGMDGAAQAATLTAASAQGKAFCPE